MNVEIARTWAERAQAELGAARRFRELGARMRRFDTNPTLLQLVKKAGQEEDQHAFWCAKMAIKLGHDSGFAMPKAVLENPSYSWQDRSEAERLLLDTVLMCCLTESMNASLLNTLYGQSGRSEAGQLLHRILKDEVKHAQIGWAYLGESCKERDCGFVSDYLVEMATLAIREELFAAVSTPLSDEAYHYGVMPQSARVEQFKSTLEEVVCAGFEHVGIDAQPLRRWAKCVSS
ncbi:MAG: hypothetical protein VX278_19280 [Myxococcota bacterium]|nr:hypothetical protein [Myxococcota bacterium]